MPLLQIKTANKNPNQKKQDFGVALGIDLGTSNSVIAFYAADSGVQVINTDQGKLIPSIVGYKGRQIFVGKDANYDSMNIIIGSIKRYMGKSWGELLPNNIDLPLIAQKEGDNSLYIDCDGHQKSPEEISGAILHYLKTQGEKYTAQNINKAVITVPAYFNEIQRQATKNAAKLAGLEVLRLINEPTAAALAYGLDQGVEGNYLVYDLGGGTFDVSLLEFSKGVFKVIGTSGDTALGGDDFDYLILDQLVALFKLHKSNLSYKDISDLKFIAKNIKEQLTFHDVDMDVTFKGNTSRFFITCNQFNSLISDFVERTLDICKMVIQEAEEKDQIQKLQGVILVGGSTRIPFIKDKLRQMFSIEPMCDLDSDQVVAIGAAYQAAHLSGQTKNPLLLDVIPLSLGIEIEGGIVEKLIYRNSQIPIQKQQEFTTSQDGQTSISIHILQGERELVADLRSLARFVLKGIPPLPSGVPRILVSFFVDTDGMLFVEAQEQTTKVQQSIEIRPSWGIDMDTIRYMLEESMSNAEEDIAKRLLQQSKVQANILINTVEKALLEDRNLLTQREYDDIMICVDTLKQVYILDNRDAIESAIVDLDIQTQLFAQRRTDNKIKSALKGKAIETVDGWLNKS